jgi:phosphate transport system permease protein
MNPEHKSSLTLRRVVARLFEAWCLCATLLCIATLVILLASVCYQGYARLSWNLLTSFPSRFPEKAGIKSALAGSMWLIGLTALIAVPVGVASAVYLEEYARKSAWRKIVETNIANLAGVPSIVYGMLGLTLFVRTMSMGRSVIAGALTLSLVILPIVILASQEALRAVPDSIRHASYALGATRWQTTSRQVLPAAIPGIMTGVILALSRALGEAAPLIIVGAVGYVAFVPEGLGDRFTALPIQIYNWSSMPRKEFHHVAAAGIMVLLAMLLCMNAVAVYLRHRYGKRIRW